LKTVSQRVQYNVIVWDEFNGAEPVHLSRLTSVILHVTMM